MPQYLDDRQIHDYITFSEGGDIPLVLGAQAIEQVRALLHASILINQRTNLLIEFLE